MATPINTDISLWHRYATSPIYRGSDPYNLSARPWIIDYTGYTHRFVSTTGDDTNDGSELSPWRTIQHAANNVAPGTVVNIRGGVYTENAETVDIYGAQRPTIRLNNSGTNGNYIAFRSYPGEPAIIDQGGVGSGFTTLTESYLIIDDLTIRNCYAAGVHSFGNYWSSNLKIINNHIHNVRGEWGLNVGGIRMDFTDSGYIANNRIHDVYIDEILGNPQTNSACVHSYQMSNTTIENNNLNDSYNGLLFKQPVQGVGGIAFRKNRISQITEGMRLVPQGSGFWGITDSQFHNNVVTDAFRGVLYGHGNNDVNYISSNVSIYNNTFAKLVSSGGEPPAALYANGANDMRWYNNITHGVARPIFAHHYLPTETVATEITYCDYNLYYNWAEQRLNIYGADPDYFYYNMADWRNNANTDSDMMNLVTSGPDLQSLESDPLFTDYANNDFSLQSGSPARLAGRYGEHIGAYSQDGMLIGADW